MKILFQINFLLFVLLFSLTNITWASENNDTKASIEEINTPVVFGRTPRLSLLNNSLLMSWTELNQDKSLAQLKFSTYQDNQWSTPLTAAKGSHWFINYADYAQVTPLSDQHLLASWLELFENSNFNYRIMVSQSFDAGISWSQPISPITKTRGEHGFLSALKVKDKTLITWISTSNYGFEVLSTMLDAQNLFAPITIVDSSTCSCCHTDMVKHNNQALLVYRDRTKDEIRDIALTSYKDNSWSKPNVIHNDQWQINGCPVNGPAISSTSLGYAITWFSASNNVEKVNFLAKTDDQESIFFTLEESNTLGYVDMTKIDNESVMLSRLSTQGNDVLIKLQTFNFNTLSLGKTISIKRPDYSGFPAIEQFQGSTYISYATRQGEIKLLKVN